ncbi:hypothetical protein FE257_001303 [Aspergillus nanangensis]|uniref:Peptidase S33 tripeptidyl aminopeptidase-like C-terminal domain-containing protein n=1 Tax=Aspergillus nanangensis TaxID=2582783 RepID=A0AAD4GPS1_ASPNN|nr:hypothetical protein FE257_001303 [Aspergillus nanangensis]
MEPPKRPSIPERQNVSSHRIPAREARSRALALIALVVPLWWCMTASPAVNGVQREDGGFHWAKVTPSPSLQYHECFDGFQCARLSVPMDYHRTDGRGRQVAIALTRLPAKVPVTDPRYGGAILINPGGPGGSGVLQALHYGRDLQTVADADTPPSLTTQASHNRYFDIIGFDPRGVNNTTPSFSCFPDPLAQKIWEIQHEADGMLGSSTDAFMRTWARIIARNTGCAATLSTAPDADSEALGEHLNTPPVARDMLSIIERHGEWREKVARQTTLPPRSHLHRDIPSANNVAQHQAMLQRTRWNRNAEKLLFWGRSYGTILGTTFATMFPDRIERVVLDAVVDAHRYYHSSGGTAIVDADAIFDQFATYCDSAGVQSCPFHVAGGSAAIKAAYYALEEGLRNASIAVAATDSRGPEVVTYSDLKTLLRVAVYQPLTVFPLLARYASEAARGDGTGLADLKIKLRGGEVDECRVSPVDNEPYASVAVLCSDAVYLQGLDEDGFAERWSELTRDSRMIGDYWAAVELDCVRWNVTPKWRAPDRVEGKTSHPLLFVNNVLDPVTPLRSAEKMSHRFQGSAVLRQDSEGHSTLAAPSFCTDSAIRKYFQTGELPPPDTLCQADLKPFLGAPEITEATMNDIRRLMRSPFAL